MQETWSNEHPQYFSKKLFFGPDNCVLRMRLHRVMLWENARLNERLDQKKLGVDYMLLKFIQ